jgi:penicillin-insensitive murein endopeptidase
MKKIFIFFLLIISPINSFAKSPWEKIKSPIDAKPESIGNHNLGCLLGAESLPHYGKNYIAMRPHRVRNFAHPEMITYIKNLASEYKKQKNGFLTVGDIGLPAGGAFSSGHASHQIGLDADFWFVTPKQAYSRKLTTHEKNNISAQSVVDLKNMKVNTLFTSKQVSLLKLAAADENVDRIFVNAAIKKNLCENYKGQDWLAKIRPWYGHHFHFHVRLKCQKNDTQCSMPEGYKPTESDGCDETLDWWFAERTEAEIAEWKEKEAKAKLLPKPTPPKRCLEIVGKNSKGKQ